MDKRLTLQMTILALGAGLVGCAPRQEVGFSRIPNLTQKIKADFEATRVPPPEAGTPREMVPHNKEQLIASAGLTFSSRRNPFALFGEEQAFETRLRYDIILSKQTPSYSLQVAPPVETTPPEAVPLEPQPYRRVAGVFFGDTIRAVIIMEDGKSYFVSPGARLGEWTVVSIDADEVVLRREGKLPREVRVRLESAPPTGAPGGAQPGGTQPSGGGRAPGAQPGGGGGGGAATGDIG